jgi:hypothetical protein
MLAGGPTRKGSNSFAGSGAPALYRRAMREERDGFERALSVCLEDIDITWHVTHTRLALSIHF